MERQSGFARFCALRAEVERSRCRSSSWIEKAVSDNAEILRSLKTQAEVQKWFAGRYLRHHLKDARGVMAWFKLELFAQIRIDFDYLPEEPEYVTVRNAGLWDRGEGPAAHLTLIYGLLPHDSLEPFSLREVRYVGQTIYPEKRGGQHYYGKSAGAKAEWMRSEPEPPKMRTLEELPAGTPIAEVDFAERLWIAYLGYTVGAPLVNVIMGPMTDRELAVVQSPVMVS
jgi:hypothetical protein